VVTFIYIRFINNEGHFTDLLINLVKGLLYTNINMVDEETKVFMNLMSNSVNLASTYVKHANRSHITPMDIKMAMMIDFIAWDMLGDRRPKNLSIENGIYMPEEVTEDFTKSSCDCIVCLEFNNIEKRLQLYKPKTFLSNAVKRNLCEACLN